MTIRWARLILGMVLITVPVTAAWGQYGHLIKSPVYVGDSPAAEDLFEQARSLWQQNRMLEAANLYQQVIEQYPDKLMSVNGIYADAPYRVNHDLIGDAPLLEAYRRAFEPVAQRALTTALHPWPNAAALESVVAHYRVTHAGIEAALKLAGLFLEEGDAVDAAGVLDQLRDHPDLAAESSNWHMLQATAALIAGQPGRLEEHRAALVKAKDDADLAKLAALAQTLRIPNSTELNNAWGQTSHVSMLENPGKPLWQINLPDPFGEVPNQFRVNNINFRGPDQGTPLPNFMIAQADSDHIYVNNFTNVIAADRVSGRIAWNYSSPDAAAQSNAFANPWMRGARMPDQRGFAIDGDHIITVLGMSYAWNLPMQLQTSTSVVCLERSTGRVIWRIEPKDIDPTLTSAAFHGTPVLAGGRLFVNMRRSQLTGFQDAYIASLDAHTGRPNWHRYISSAAAAGRNSSRSMAQVLVDSGRVYTIDSLGAVSCLDARTGVIFWLSLIPDVSDLLEINRIGMGVRVTGSSWQSSSPILVGAGLIVPSLGTTPSAVLFDPLTGHHLQDLSTPNWTESDYFVRIGSDILTVGAAVSLIDGQTLNERWHHRLVAVGEVKPSGRAAITDDRIMVPLGDKVTVLDLANGNEVSSHELIAPGNLLALNDQLIVADNQSIRNYMNWDRAYARLKDDVIAHPADPHPGLTLAYLAMAAGQREAISEGMDAALAAIHQAGDGAAPALKHEVFQQILALARTDTLEVPLRRAMFDRLSSVIPSPIDEVDYRMSLGSFLTDTENIKLPANIKEAVGQYQSILMDATLSAQLYEQSGASRQAGMEARTRLEAIIQKVGPKVYESYDEQAARRLAELVRAPTVYVPAFEELARQFPLSRSAPAALVAAADGLDSGGDARGAIAQLRRAYSISRDNSYLPLITGRVAQILARVHQTSQAARWLERVRREHPDIVPLQGDKPVTVDAWLAELAKQPAGDLDLPALALPLGQPVVLPGRLITPTLQPQDSWPRDMLLLVEGRTLVLRSGPALDKAWELLLPDERCELLSFTREQAILWSDASGQLIAIDTQTGKPAWPMLDVRAALAQVGGPAELRAAQHSFDDELNPNRRIVRNGRIMTLEQIRAEGGDGAYVEVNDGVICIGDPSGRLTGIDRQSGRTLWHRICPFDKVTGLHLSADTLVVVGVEGLMSDNSGSGRDASGELMVLDPSTGEMRIPTIEDRGAILWASLSSEGMLVYCTGTQMVGRPTSSGAVAWRTNIPAGQQPPSLRLGDDLLFLFEPPGGLTVVDPDSGKVLNPFFTMPENGAGLAIRSLDQQWQILTYPQAIALGPDAKVRWRDSIPSFSKELQLQLLGERSVVLLSLANPPGRPAMMPGLNRQVFIMGPDGVLRRMIAPPQVNLPAAPGLAQPPGNAAVPNPGNVPAPGAVENQHEPVEVPLHPMPRLRHQEEGPADDAAALEAKGAGNWKYKIYVLDRFSGSVIEERELSDLTESINPHHAVFLNNRIVLTTGSATLVIPGAAARP